MPPYKSYKTAHALEFFEQWAEYTKEALRMLAPRCPAETPKTRRWRLPQGPTGLIYHYTGGPDGIASVRWSNENAANTGSSWHCTVLDSRLTQLDGLLRNYPLVEKYLPVTALLHANIKQGTWHGNWTNSRTFGLENRNLGRLTEVGGVVGVRSRGTFRPLKDAKRAVWLNDAWWESYTKEQLVANINIGKMLRQWRGCDFDASWVLPHSAIWWGKSDVGPAFPMDAIRASVFSDVEAGALKWLDDYTASVAAPFITDPSDYQIRGVRDGGEESLKEAYTPMLSRSFDRVAGAGWRDQLNTIRRNLRTLGYYLDPEVYDAYLSGDDKGGSKEVDPSLKWATIIFQMSTRHRSFGPYPLKADGIPGPATLKAIEKRLSWFGYKLSD